MKDTEKIDFECPHCERHLRVAASAAGKRRSCPRCKKPITIPRLPEFVDDVDVIRILDDPEEDEVLDGDEEDYGENEGKAKKKADEGVTQLAVGCLVFVGFIVLVAVITSWLSSPSSPTTNQGGFQGGSTSKKWYNGGTLHNATMEEWRRATYANKLATAADIVTKLRVVDGADPSTIDIEREVRPAAEFMVTELDNASRDGSIDYKRVPEVAAFVYAIYRNR